MSTRLIIDGNAVYEIDEDCLECQKKKIGYRENRLGGTFQSMDQSEKKKSTPERTNR